MLKLLLDMLLFLKYVFLYFLRQAVFHVIFKINPLHQSPSPSPPPQDAPLPFSEIAAQHAALPHVCCGF